MESANAQASIGIALSKGSLFSEDAQAEGRYSIECRDKDGKLKWSEEFDNLVTTAGRNFALDTLLAGSAYTVSGPYLGLINGNASTAVIGDTMASHATWVEVGGTNAPSYTGNRKTVGFSAAANAQKASNILMTFDIGSAGTIGGCFLVLGSGASATKDTTSGILYSAGAFSAGSKTVAQFDTLTVTYTASM